jgi:hypothetical protein
MRRQCPGTGTLTVLAVKWARMALAGPPNQAAPFARMAMPNGAASAGLIVMRSAAAHTAVTGTEIAGATIAAVRAMVRGPPRDMSGSGGAVGLETGMSTGTAGTGTNTGTRGASATATGAGNGREMAIARAAVTIRGTEAAVTVGDVLLLTMACSALTEQVQALASCELRPALVYRTKNTPRLMLTVLVRSSWQHQATGARLEVFFLPANMPAPHHLSCYRELVRIYVRNYRSIAACTRPCVFPAA